MRSLALAALQEPHQLQAAVRAVDAEVTLTGRGRFCASLVQADFAQLWLQHGEESVARIVRVAATQDRAILLFLPQGAPPIRINHAPLDPAEGWLAGRGIWSYQRTEGEAAWSSMSLPPEVFARACAILGGRELAPGWGSRVSLNAPGLAALRHHHARAVAMVRSTPGLLAHPAAAASMEERLIAGMVGALAGPAVEDRAARRRHAVLMARLAALLDQHRQRPLGVMEICASLGISEWTLRALCHDCLGMSPHRFLLLRRLHLARRALLAGAPGEARVTGIAMALGFTELGRFAVVYREVFGKSPSATLARSGGGGAGKLPEIA